MTATTLRRRAVRIAHNTADFDFRPDGTIYVRSRIALGSYPRKLTERLEHWAQNAPDRVFLARRGCDGHWLTISYAETLARVRSVGQALLDRRLSVDRPLVIVSGNSIEHALLALGSMYAGIPYAPLAPAYSLIAKQYDTLRYLFDLLRPGLVFAAEGEAYEPALRATMPNSAELVTHASRMNDLSSTSFAELAATPPTNSIDQAHSEVGPHTIAKILFTSGSTGKPKGVINTQRMLCANQEQLLTMMPFMGEEPPVFCDWLPWNHTFGGNHNFGLTLYNGGTLYIDDGRPIPGAIETTVRNLREVATTAYFNVPRGYELLVPYLREDAELRDTFFRRVKILFYAAAGLGQRFWDELESLAAEACAEEILLMAGLGATETSPFCLSTGIDGAASGEVGLPVAGVDLKLAPVTDKLEARVRGPNITPGFWKDPERTRAAFDEEGYYRLGDALRFVDPTDPQLGFLFDGRINEDYKLSTGTWVSVGPLRSRLLAHFAPYMQDVVFAGHDREYVAALVFPNLTACRALALDTGAEASPAQIVASRGVQTEFRERLESFSSEHPASSTCVRRMILLEAPASLDAGEITEKGSVNQRAVLQNRATLVEELYAASHSERVISIPEGSAQPFPTAERGQVR